VAIVAISWPFALRDSGVIAAGNVMQTVPPGCGWIANESGPNEHTLVCNGGTLRGFEDWECGHWTGRPLDLNCNISGGSSRHRGYVVLSPDNGKGTILEDGHLNKLLLVRGKRHGGTQFRIQPTMKRGLVACDAQGCLDVMKALRSANAGKD
jgi:hypothetical protein